MSFFKGHGLGNDYIALVDDLLSCPLGPAAVRLLCDRHRGIGSDGVLVRVPGKGADFGLRIWNPDGSEAEKSGNGIRIFAAYLLEQGDVGIGAPFSIRTEGGTVEVLIHGRTPDGTLDIEVEMGQARFRSTDVGLRGPDREPQGELLELASGERVAIRTVSVGNPHCVIFEEEWEPERMARVAGEVATHPAFAGGTNVQFARAAGPGAVEAWIWERGAGPTHASGSSACAVASAAVRAGLLAERQVEVRMPGGVLHVSVRADWTLLLRGPVEGVCRGELTQGMRARLEALSCL